MKLPYSSSNCDQLVTSRGARPSGSFGSSRGARSVKPTKAATAVGADASTFWEEGTSSTSTPGAVYVGTGSPASSSDAWEAAHARFGATIWRHRMPNLGKRY